MNFILNKAILPKTNKIKEKSRVVKSVNFDLLENKYKDPNLTSIIEENNFNALLKNLFNSIIIKEDLSKNLNKMSEAVFNSIKYKNKGGIRLEVKGRLTKRYRADRAIFKVKWKGGLKNIDSSYKGLSSIKTRGYINSNVEYSMFTSKRRIGAFAVKGWISGK